ncbi:MAG: hypothetical protein JRF33_20210 [Deltaproteobacteria bacterium]|nr:hypothetical protein [Deltaproteobacteria bacterium]
MKSDGRPRDTCAEAWRIQIEILRKHSPEQRMKAGLEMADLARDLIKRGIRLRHPQYSEDQVNLALCKAILPSALFEKAYPDAGAIQP